MNDPNMFFVCAMGIGVVFIGLITFIFITMSSSAIIRSTESHKKAQPVEEAEPVQEPIANRQQFVASVSAVIAEQLNTDVNAIKIKSIN